MPAKYMAMKELCQMLDVTRLTVLRWRKRGIFTIGCKLGRDWRFDKAEVELWLKQQKKK